MLSNGLMRDDLRAKGLLPNTEPYSNLANFQHFGDGGGETVANPAVFLVTGNDAIVDWVIVELRSDNSISTPISTHAALLQRDGDVVAVDGISPVRFLGVAPGQYHVSVRHRNHLGVMTQEVFNLSNQTASIDFSSPVLPLYGNNPCGIDASGVRVLWLGDANRDKKSIFQGPGNDIFSLFSLVMYQSGNVNHNSNYIVEGYNLADFNLDGNAIYNGPNNDRSLTFIQAGMNCSFVNCGFSEQIP